MKKAILIALSILALGIEVRSQENFSISLEPLNITNLPGVQSYAMAENDGKWLVLGGRLDGLHRRQPPFAFLASDNNTSVFVIDPIQEKFWSTSISVLPTAMFEQLQSTNMEFTQRGNTLYVVGGYGYSTTNSDHITHPNLTAVDVAGAIDAIVNGNSIVPYFRQINDTRMAVTGGYLGLLNNKFYLVGGHKFDGRYNPMNHPSFTQLYTDEIREFEIDDDGTTMSIVNYSATKDANLFHRRDYNLVNQIFPDGSKGFTAFSGVFRPNVDLPWFDVVDIKQGSHKQHPNFQQLLSQYHSAHLPIYDSIANEMHTIFFGGMSMYDKDANGTLVVDSLVPFVKTISQVTRFPNDSMVEYKLGLQMPGFLGSGAEFFPVWSQPYYDNNVLKLNDLSDERELVGYIYGGIESIQNNIFWINDGTQSNASSKIFKVFLHKGVSGVNNNLQSNDIIELNVYPNPSKNLVFIEVNSQGSALIDLSVLDIQGRLVYEMNNQQLGSGMSKFSFSTDSLKQGVYFVRIQQGKHRVSKKLIVH